MLFVARIQRVCCPCLLSVFVYFTHKFPRRAKNRKFDADKDLKKYFATDPTSTFQSDKGKVRPGYNPQAGSEGKNKLIVVNDVTNESNDSKQMTPMTDKLEETKKELGIEEKTHAIFDAGYDSEKEILKNNSLFLRPISRVPIMKRPRPWPRGAVLRLIESYAII